MKTATSIYLRPPSVEHQEWLIQQLTSRKTGILKALTLFFRNADESRAHIAVTELTETSRYTQFIGGISATGVGLYAPQAVMVAIGEAVEHYCAYFVPEDLPQTTYKDLRQKGFNALGPYEWPLYSSSQYNQEDFPFRPFTDETVVRWVEGLSLLGNGNKLVPAGLVYISYKQAPGEVKICPTNFTGIASGLSRDYAILSGIYEIIERDAMMIWWLNQIARPKCRLDSGSWFSRVFRERFAPSGLRFELWEITSDLDIPTFFGLVTDPYEKVVSAGFAAKPDPQWAALKALFECIQNRLGMLPMKSERGREEYCERLGPNYLPKKGKNGSARSLYADDFSDVTRLHSSLQLYTDPDMAVHLDRVRSSIQEVTLDQSSLESTGDPSKDLAFCLEILEQKGFDVIVVDMTLPDVADLGFSVVRVLIPGLVPYSVTAWPYLGNPRIYDVPELLGFARKEEKDLEKAPMPYA